MKYFVADLIPAAPSVGSFFFSLAAILPVSSFVSPYYSKQNSGTKK
jgi:hypothetical protein